MRKKLLTWTLLWLAITPGWLGCSQTVCWIEGVNVTYKYETSCSGVAASKQGTFVWSLPKSQSNPRAFQIELLVQAQRAGLAFEEVQLVWEPSQCPEPTNTTANPLKPINFFRIVLAPDDGTSNTVQRLLACEPVNSKPPGTLNNMYLFACRTGQSIQAVCTFSLEPQ